MALLTIALKRISDFLISDFRLKKQQEVIFQSEIETFGSRMAHRVWGARLDPALEFFPSEETSSNLFRGERP